MAHISTMMSSLQQSLLQRHQVLTERFIYLADLHLLFPDQAGLEGGLLP
jgi:hypothetical protein